MEVLGRRTLEDLRIPRELIAQLLVNILDLLIVDYLSLLVFESIGYIDPVYY